MGRHEVIVLDTHVLIWLTTNNRALGKLSRATYDQAFARAEIAISAISFWEIAMLTRKGRLSAARMPAEHRALILAEGARELPITGDIAILAAELDNLHGDPADRLIVATAIAHDATLMTADRALLRWRHKLTRQNAAR